jgi:hypothetical protein
LHAPLTQTISFIPTPNVWDGVGTWRRVLPSNRQAAPGVKKLAGRLVFDLWGGGYASSARALEQAFRYGLTHSVVVWHNWQRWGYDYRLPDIYPPNPEYGTPEEFQQLVKTCKDHGVLFAPHDNYIDLYPDAEGFTYKNVAFTKDGEPVRGWFNEGRKAQAYRWNTVAYRPFMERNLGLIRENIAPTAYFIDVWSSIGPYESWTHDGQFQDRVFTRNTWGETFAWIRNYLGEDAPQISESGHDQLIGYLDGGQTNHLRVGNPVKGNEWFVWNIRCADAERIPWFDAAYHDRFAAHGAGYDGRYRGGLDANLHGIYSDDYVTAEVMTGHPPMVSEPFSRDVVRKYWFLHDLMDALSHARRVKEVEFVDNDLHRQHVIWDVGEHDVGETWINRGDTDWTVEAPIPPAPGRQILPPYGFYASIRRHSSDIEESCHAGITRKEGVIAEWCDSRPKGGFYCNARPMVGERLPVRVAVESLRPLGDRKLEVTFRWEAEAPLSESLNPFVHFVDADGKIRFQADHTFAVPTTQWQGMVRSSAVTLIPSDLKPGDSVELRVGLWRSDLGRRPLQGPNDGEMRVRLGAVKLEGKEDQLTDMKWIPLEPTPDPVLARMNHEKKLIVFGPVKTDSACRITFEESTLRLTPLPNGPAFTVYLDKEFVRFGHTTGPTQVECVAQDGSVMRVESLKEENDAFVLKCEPSVFAYRLKP